MFNQFFEKEKISVCAIEDGCVELSGENLGTEAAVVDMKDDSTLHIAQYVFRRILPRLNSCLYSKSAMELRERRFSWLELINFKELSNFLKEIDRQFINEEYDTLKTNFTTSRYVIDDERKLLYTHNTSRFELSNS